MTGPYAEVIGDPIAHSKSPLIHAFWLTKLGIRGDYRATRVTPSDLASYLAERRGDSAWRGCNVTMPLKQAVMPLLDGLDPSAEWAGSVNCVYRDQGGLWGCNTDASGIGAAIEDVDLEGKPVAVIGAGAAAQCAQWILSREGAQLRALARDGAKADAVFGTLGVSGRAFGITQAAEALDGCALVVNATPLGMDGFAPMPEAILAALERMASDAAVFDMVYDPIETALLQAARRCGRSPIDGLVMLIGQARDSFSHFFPASPPTWSDRALRERLTR